MRHYHTLEETQIHKTWLTIGSFDGVHLGHQEILRHMVAEARAAENLSAVLTFHPHPSTVLRGRQGAFYLSTPQERAELLGDLGIDVVITLEFDRQLAQMSAADFISLLKKQLDLRSLWVGYNFALGRDREGDIPSLQNLADLMEFEINVVPPISVNGQAISSSLIRSFLGRGEVSKAAGLLGRWYSIEGEVVSGDGRGRLIGVPTANLAIWPEKMIPADGVYAGWACVDSESFLAVANIGIRPTFESNDPTSRVEVHILDFNANLYGNKISFEFVERLRGEQRFSSVDDLIHQITADIHRSREILGERKDVPHPLIEPPG